MRALSLRRPALVGLTLAGALALTGCSNQEGEAPAPAPTETTPASPASSASSPASTPSSNSSTSSAAPSASTPAASSPSVTASTSAAPSSSASSSAPSTAVGAATSAEAEQECSGLTGEQAWAQVHARGTTYTPDPAAATAGVERMLVEAVDYSDYDDCAVLSAIVAPMGATGSSGVELHLFHHGEYVEHATADTYAASVVERLDDDTFQATYVYPLPGESNAEASGTAVSTFSWDEASGTVVASGDTLAVANERVAAASSSAASSSEAAGEESTSEDEFYALSNSRGQQDSTGFCFGSADGVTCFGKHNNSATLPAKGEPTSTRDLPATGFEDPMPNSFDIAPGESHTHAGITCTATAAGFDCVNEKTGAAISVAGPDMELTPPTG